MDVQKFIIDFHDFLAPKLDTYEQAIYLYIIRHSRILDEEEALIGFKSARKKFAFGIGKSGTSMSEGVIYKKLNNLESKGCIKVIGSEYNGTRIKAFLPYEIDGVVNIPEESPPINIDDIDFFEEPKYRKCILEREGHRCFYCLKELNENNYVLEHVVSRPEGNNSYKNLVAACRSCNNKKSEKNVLDFIRSLYRDDYLSEDEFEKVKARLESLKSGELRPTI